MKLSELAGFLGGKLEGDPEFTITGIAKIEEADSGQVTFISNSKYEKDRKSVV